MEKNPFIFTIFIFLLTITTSTVTSAQHYPTIFQEFEATVQALRRQGYTLFTNAITTSDIQLELLSITEPSSSFTIFAPKDAMIFALDMSADANLYVSTLRYHIIPNRLLTFSDLRSLSSPVLDTLLPNYSVLVGKILGDDVVSGGVMVDGSRVSEPDLFVGERIVVHGIDGILVSGLNGHNQDSSGSDMESVQNPPVDAPMPVSGFNSSIPAPGPNIQSEAPTPIGSSYLSTVEAPGPISGINSSEGPIGSDPPSLADAPVPISGNIPGKGPIGSDPPSPAKAPVPISGNIPAKGTNGSDPHYPAEAPVPISGNIPAKGPTGSRSQSPSGSPAPTPGLIHKSPTKETLNLGRHSQSKSPAPDSGGAGFHRKIPVEEALTPASHHSHRYHVPEASVHHGRNIPVKGPSVIFPHRGKNVRYYRHRRHRRHHHHSDDL